jgi:hypothetical protein
MVAALYAALRISPIPSRDHRERYDANFCNLLERCAIGLRNSPIEFTGRIWFKSPDR